MGVTSRRPVYHAGLCRPSAPPVLRLALPLFLVLLAGCAAPPPATPADRLDDPALGAALGDLLCKLEPRCGLLHLHVIDNAAEQAHMLADGRLLFSLGLLLATDGEDEIAFVLAHELAHRRLRHSPLAAPAQRLPMEIAADRAARARLIELGWRADAGTRLLSRLLERERQRDADGGALDASITQLRARLEALGEPSVVPAHRPTPPAHDWATLLGRYRAATP